MKILLFFLPFLFITVTNSQDFTILNLKAYSGNEASLPVVTGNDLLTIEFDIQSDFTPDLDIVFRYCDRNWMPYQNIFLQNSGQNIYYNIDYVRLPITVEEAKYRFDGDFPDGNGYVSFPYSGKWRFYVTDAQDTSVVYASGKFFYIQPEIEISPVIKNALLEDKTYYPLELGRVFDITTSFTIPDEMYPSFVTETEIIENHKIEYPIIIDKGFNTNVRQFYWDGNRKFSFSARDIRPGNEYRQADLRNHNVFNSKNVRAQFDGIETSRFYKQGRSDLNGGSLFTRYNDEYATYLNAKFEIRTPSDNMGDVFLVGAFNDWQLLPEFKMDNSGGLYSKTVRLKRGIYDYQYVTADVINDRIKNENWVVLEGNFWETKNDYYIFVYYSDPNYGGYDRIIGYSKISGR